MHELPHVLTSDGAWVAPIRGSVLEVLNSATEQLYATIPAGDAADIDHAVRTSKAAFAPWSELPATERGKLLGHVADALETPSRRAAVMAHE